LIIGYIDLWGIAVKNNKFENLVCRLKSIGDMLIPYNFPLNDPQVEDDIHPLKIIETTVDGYRLIIYFSKADYDNYFLETAQIFGVNMPFVPFCLVVKIAQKFLGNENLSLVEIPRSNRKVYCWSVCKDKNGSAIEYPYNIKIETCQFEGFEYFYMQPDQVNLI
jgi:hypothetical protein